MKRTACAKMVSGFNADYTYYERSLSVSDFEQFDYDSTYKEIMEQLGMPNGTIGSGTIRPYYELKDGRFVICGGWDKIMYISIVNFECHEYYLLPPKLKKKSNIIKNRELETAKQSEMNCILWMLEEKELEIKDWRQSTKSEQRNIPLGEYSLETLKKYTDRNITAEISYYFGNYREYGPLPLFQIIWLFEEQKPIYFGYILWDTDTYWHIYIDRNIEYVEDGEDCIVGADKIRLKGEKQILHIDGVDMNLDVINLSPNMIANSLTEFFEKQNVIKNKRNACVEFWGENGNGKYVCLLAANPQKIGWDISADSRKTKYYFATIDTLENKITSVNIILLER
ncbi:MAG: hypothetical protein HDR25_03635 [Lachnospiraceae bacterium]|nr:hypothetical protein [Lachnospiraceae bacterium]